MQLRRLVSRPVLVAAAAGTGSVLGAAGGSVAAAAYFARKVITPDELQPDDVEIVRHDAESVTFAPTPDTVLPGRFGVWLDGGAGHARVGEILGADSASVTRRLVAVDRGRIELGPARWNQYYYWDRPSVSLGLPDEDVSILSDVGPLPGWLVRPGSGTAGSDWAILVHGRGARREETLRAVPVLRDAGWTSLVTAYRNDRDAPRGPDGRYNLGLSEWRDVEAAMVHAIDHGAEEVVLVGWSMGGAIVLQALVRSWLADRVTRVVLDAPVIDWADVLRHQAALNRVPGPVGALGRSLIGRRSARRLVGVHEPIDVAETDWVARADELAHPVLLIHSEDDEFVPAGPSAALAAKRPDLVRYVPWRGARHTKEWNQDPQRWEQVVADFLCG